MWGIFKKTILAATLALLPVGMSAQSDTASFRSRLSGMLDTYLSALERESLPDKISECDFILSNTPDDSTRAFVCSHIIKYYMNTKVMGDEAVAVYLYDAFIDGGAVSGMAEADVAEAKVFAEFNRSSLLGLEAPEVDLQTDSGESLRLPGSSAVRKILYFYDTSCAKCSLETMLLGHALDDVNIPVELFAVYVGEDMALWRSYVNERFRITNPLVLVHHCWDPDGSTDMVRNYSLLQTPRLYLVDPQGRIEGRRLNVQALVHLLGLESARDELSSRVQPGQKLRSVKLQGTFLSKGRERHRNFDTARVHGPGLYIIFYSSGCPRCMEQLGAARMLAARRKASFLAVELGSIFESDERKGKVLLDSFDLSVLPETIELDAAGRVVGKDIDLKNLF